ncbi:13631_t:CDS:2 [Dentiscutata erythropus]|uniref:13631_t:CDS:1 n=1 Tax=Dentiscutata erythropus TaxID=1348616 RepID=A0A9N8ZSF1_9GLOM|nr:13631_t:CDS:2 [Dentiscutata erythropus]
MASTILPQLFEYSLMFRNLSRLNCSYHWPAKKDLIFNVIADICHNIENLKATVWHEDEGIALAKLVCAQKCLKKFSILNSNSFASFPVQSLESQIQSLNSLTFKDMHSNSRLVKVSKFNYTTFQLNDKAIFSLTQRIKITKLKFKHCEGLSSSISLPITSMYSNLTSLEYSYGGYNIYDNATPINLLSDLVKTNSKTLERIIFDWHSNNFLECTQLIRNIAECTVNLKHLKIPLYTLEQLALILQTTNQLKKLEIYMEKKINPHYALFLFINIPFNNLKNSTIQLSFDGYGSIRPKNGCQQLPDTNTTFWHLHS